MSKSNGGAKKPSPKKIRSRQRSIKEQGQPNCDKIREERRTYEDRHKKKRDYQEDDYEE